mgnify:FL=1
MKKFLTVCLAAGTLAASALGFSACSGNTLVVYTEAGFPPFEYRSENSIVGVDVDIMNMVGERLGMDVHFESVDFDIIIDTVSQGRLANVGAAGISITEERKEKVDFSIPYYTASLYVIYREDGTMAPEISESTAENGEVIYWDSLAGMTIGVQGGTTADLFLTDEINEDWGVLYNTETNKRSFDSLSVAVNDIGLNSNVVIIDELPAQTLVANNEGLACLPLYYKGETVEEDEAAVDEYAIAVTPGQDELLNAINEVLRELIDDVDADGNNGIDRLIMNHLDLASD